ncbi:MAG TPA: hypothetical protein PLQ15_12795 [Syntrophales bacterium]|nr:hypothetical protein [Syntrophales bacterium]
MAKQRITRRQKDISRLLRERRQAGRAAPRRPRRTRPQKEG